jgi:hypothetical protein
MSSNKSKFAVLIILALVLSSCSGLFAQVPVDATGSPVVARETVTILNPAIEEKADVALDVWCKNLTNVRRIALRFIHVVDPDWQSVCHARELAAAGNAPD